MSTRLRIILASVIVPVVLLVLLARSIMFTVDEREVAVVLQFGEPVQSYTEPGLRFKLPFVQEVRKLPKTLQFWSGTGREVLDTNLSYGASLTVSWELDVWGRISRSIESADAALEEARRLAEAGVEAITTDRPKWLRNRLRGGVS